MKFLLVALIGVVAFAAGQPVYEAAAPAAVVPVDEASVIAVAEVNPDQETMEASGSALKIIEHKLEHWLKKCYKKGGCGSTGYGYGGHSVRPVPVPVPVYTPVYTPTPYLGGYGSSYGGGYGSSYGGGHGYGYGSSYGSYGSYGGLYGASPLYGAGYGLGGYGLGGY